MAIVQVADFGESNGIRTFRINGSREDLEKVINECRREKAEIINPAEIQQVRKGDWTLLLKIKVAVKVSEVG